MENKAPSTSTAPTSDASKPSQAFVPYEQRESNHVKPWGFVKNLAITLLLAKSGYVVGHIGTNLFSGKGLGASIKAYTTEIVANPVHFNEATGKTSLNKPVAIGMFLGLFTAFAEAYLKWRKHEHHRLSVQDTMDKVQTLVSEDNGTKELAEQKKIEQNIKEIIALREGKQAIPHTQKLQQAPAHEAGASHRLP